MVGIGVLVVSVWGGVSPICGIEAMRAQWSLCVVGIVVMVVSAYMWVAVGGRRRSQWSSGVLDGRKVGVLGSPMWVRDVLLQNSSREVLWEVGCCAGVPCRSPPRRMWRFGCCFVSKVVSQVRVSW